MYEDLQEGFRFLYQRKDKKNKNLPDTGAHSRSITERQLMLCIRISAMIDAIVIYAPVNGEGVIQGYLGVARGERTIMTRMQ